MKIELINIDKKYNKDKERTEVFESLNLKIEDGDIISIIGPNGCGKSTLLNIIANIDSSFSGSLKSEKEYTVSYMFQKDLLIPWRTSFDNALLGVELQNKISSKIIKDTTFLFKQLGIKDKINSFPSTLSGGERQKVALIRTILSDSDLILLDEPFASIDFQSKIRLYHWLFTYFKQKRKTVLIVTHDLEEAINMSNKIIILNNKPKGIYKEINISIGDKERDPVELRKNPIFSNYFSEIWEDLRLINNKK